ncbi:glycosyltransferase family 2 protein [Thermodesulfobacteriota bacterium]
MSIIVSVYNGADTLQRSLDSVWNQNYPHKELIVIDGASTDGSVNLIEANESSIHYWESEPDRGIYHAWNKGLGHATGDWIHFHGADDYFTDPGVFSKVAAWLKQSGPDIRVAYGREAIVSSTGELLEIRGEAWEKVGHKFVREMSIPHSTVFHHRSLFDDHGEFDESFRVCADYHLLLKELKSGQAVFVPDMVMKTVSYEGLSRKWDMLLTVAGETLRAQRLNGLFPHRPDRIWNVSKLFAKYWLARIVGDKWTRQIVDGYRLLTGRPRIWTKMN